MNVSFLTKWDLQIQLLCKLVKNFNFNRAWESYVSSEISPNQKCVFNIFVSTLHIHIIQKALKFYLYIYIYLHIYKVSIKINVAKINVATDKGNNRNEIWHRTKGWNWSNYKKVAGSGYECELSSVGDLTRFEKRWDWGN